MWPRFNRNGKFNFFKLEIDVGAFANNRTIRIELQLVFNLQATNLRFNQNVSFIVMLFYRGNKGNVGEGAARASAREREK